MQEMAISQKHSMSQKDLAMYLNIEEFDIDGFCHANDCSDV